MDNAPNDQQKRKVKGKAKGSSTKKRQWTRKEDEVLIGALLELCNEGWKTDNGIFKSGYTAVLEKAMKTKFPSCNLKASPHIESRLKTLKKHCNAITDMRGARGLNWNDEEHAVVCDNVDSWETWVKSHPDAKGLRNKPFPYYDNLCIIFGKNQANGKDVETTPDAVEEPDHEEANNNAENVLAVDESKDIDVSVDSVEANQMPLQGCSTSTTYATKKRSRSSDSWSSGLGEVAKLIRTFLEESEARFSLLVGILGRQADADMSAAEKRARVNGELKKIPNLSLQARLRAASLTVSDPAKVDLFFSLPDDERKEWVSMLLTGLI